MNTLGLSRIKTSIDYLIFLQMMLQSTNPSVKYIEDLKERLQSIAVPYLFANQCNYLDPSYLITDIFSIASEYNEF